MFSCPVEFICEHYLTVSESLLRVIHCLLSQKNYVEILKKNQIVFERGKGELENAKRREHESIFRFKKAFLECFQTRGAEGRGEQRRGLRTKALMRDLGTRLESRQSDLPKRSTGKTLWK